jgi:tetratricopeptide (TPR) repeat protein
MGQIREPGAEIGYALRSLNEGTPVIMISALSLALVLVASGPSPASESCATCNPDRLIDLAEQTMAAALSWHLVDGELPEDLAAIQAMSALELAEGGDLGAARPFAIQAATTCMLSGRGGCSEALAVLAEAAVTSDDAYDEALAWLSLVPYEDMTPRQCVGAVTLRFRLAERKRPRSAEASWADRCGVQGGLDEPGYRAAKAALLRGELDDAERRIARLRAFGTSYAVRAQYLYAVARTARGDLAGAREAFTAITVLPPSRYRSQDEDDARALAWLQLARIERERDDHEAALAAYRSVPSLHPARPAALVEGAVVAAHTGDLGAARNYLEALPRYRPDARTNVDVARLLASLAVVDGDEETARATFAALAAEGVRLREERLSDAAPPFRAQLESDPSLGGILDPVRAARLLALEREIAELVPVVEEGRRDVAFVRAKLSEGGPNGPLKDALIMLREADHLLRRAEGLIGLVEKRGVTLAGPEGAATTTARRAHTARQTLDAAIARVAAQQAAVTARALRILDDTERDLDAASERLSQLRALGDEIVDDGLTLLASRADTTVRQLEMSEDIGMMEILWQRKLRATLEVQRVHTEYTEGRATLKSDTGEGTD